MKLPSLPPLPEIRKKLDARFYGLESVKRQILELAARIRNSGTMLRYGILLNDPAGTGKTSVANVIAELFELSSENIEFSVIRDSEALSDSSQIYENARPGLLIERLKAADTANLVLRLNEIDKATAGRGCADPLDPLLSLVDGPYRDTFIDCPIPTDGILLIATSNTAGKLSRPILDRFYRIEIPAYSGEAKRAIFADYVFPQALKKVNIPRGAISVPPKTLSFIVDTYAVDPGVRELERIADRLIGDFLLRREMENTSQITYTAFDVRQLLGTGQVINRTYRENPGQALCAFLQDGIAQYFQMQAVINEGTGKFQTINIPQIQQEYCRIAYEAVKCSLGEDAHCIDIMLIADRPIPDSVRNYTGCAAAIAMLSSMNGIILTPAEVFIGGCGANGELYLDEINLLSLLQQLPASITSFYSVIGVSELVQGAYRRRLALIETPSILVLAELLAKWHK